MVQIYVEARRDKGALRPLKKPRVLMASDVSVLVHQGYLREELDGGSLALALTDKRL